MKKLKKIIILFTAALFCMLPILSQPMTAKAAEPVTYYIKYDAEENDWRYQTGSSWNDKAEDRTLYYMTLDIKDGDSIVLDATVDFDKTFYVNLKNLTILNAPSAVVTTKSFEEVYIVNGVTAAINGDVKNAYVYDGGVANFNNNVQNVYVYESAATNINGNITNLYVYDPTDPDAKVNCLGTVDYVKAYDDDYVYYEYYNFAAGSLSIDRGNMNTDASKYSTTAPSASAAPSAPAASTTTTPSASDDELDDVPKTGDFSVSPLWFLGIAVACMLGYYKLERR